MNNTLQIINDINSTGNVHSIVYFIGLLLFAVLIGVCVHRINDSLAWLPKPFKVFEPATWLFIMVNITWLVVCLYFSNQNGKINEAIFADAGLVHVEGYTVHGNKASVWVLADQPATEPETDSN